MRYLSGLPFIFQISDPIFHIFDLWCFFFCFLNLAKLWFVCETTENVDERLWKKCKEMTYHRLKQGLKNILLFDWSKTNISQHKTHATQRCLLVALIVGSWDGSMWRTPKSYMHASCNKEKELSNSCMRHQDSASAPLQI